MGCSNSWCSRPVVSRGLCGPCNLRRLRGRDYLSPPRRKAPDGSSVQDRLNFYGWTVIETGCWEFNGVHNKAGYGILTTPEKKHLLAHRVAYETWCGPIPEDRYVLHQCDNPPCINPEHLWLGTYQDNADDMKRKARSRLGERHWHHILTDAQVQEILLRAQNGESQRAIARSLGVSPSHVCKLVNRRYRTRTTKGNDFVLQD